MFIKLPFIIEGVFIGLISSLLVYPALLGSVKAINYIFTNFTSWSIRLSFNPGVWIWLFSLVVVITLIGSYRAASNFLK
jgi:ABC-type antimicrobial peptide transport system permease subunit